MLTFTLSKEEVEGLKSDNKVTIIFAHSCNLDSITELWRGLEGHKKGTANLECVCSVPQLCPMISWAVACQAPLSMVILQATILNWNSVQFSCSVVSDSLRPRESQHAMPPYPSQTPRVYWNSCLSLDNKKHWFLNDGQ